jgi:hypothetical protein
MEHPIFCGALTASVSGLAMGSYKTRCLDCAGRAVSQA